MAVDFNKIVSAAAEAYLGEGRQDSPNGRTGEDAGHHRFGGIGAVALGAGLAVAARAVYARVRRFDLAQVAGKVEGKLNGSRREDG